MKHTAIMVPVIESERGWGSKIDDYMVCNTEDDAKVFVHDFNSRNTEKTTPEWYMYADFEPRPLTVTETQYKALIESKDGRMWLSELKQVK